MGRRPKSDEEKELSGAYAKNPQRRKKKASLGEATSAGAPAEPVELPVPSGLGSPPAGFLNKHSPTSLAHLEAWTEVMRGAEASGLRLTEAHRIDVEALARAIVIMRRSEKSSDCKKVTDMTKELGIGKMPIKREIEQAAEKPENDEWSRLNTPPAPPATRVQ